MAETKFLKEMGKRISGRRKALGLTQEAFAEKVGVSTQMISNLELGKKAIRPENLVRVCEELSLSADFVLTGKENMTEIDSLSEKLVYLTEEELKILGEILDYMKKKK